MGYPDGVPKDAIEIPMHGGEGLPEPTAMAVGLLNSVQVGADKENEQRKMLFESAANFWIQDSLYKRKMGQALQSPPAPPVSRLLKSKMVEMTGVTYLYLWYEDGAPVGTTPVLPPVEEVKQNFAHVGVALGGNYYQCCADDTMPDGAMVNEERGTFKKARSLFGFYYLRQ